MPAANARRCSCVHGGPAGRPEPATKSSILRRYAELLGRTRGFLAALAQLHSELQSLARGRLPADTASRRPNTEVDTRRGPPRRSSGSTERRLPDRERHKVYAGASSLQRARAHGRCMPTGFLDRAMRRRLILSHRHRVVLVRLGGQATSMSVTRRRSMTSGTWPAQTHTPGEPTRYGGPRSQRRCAFHRVDHMIQGRAESSSSGGPPPILATSSCFTRSTLKRWPRRSSCP